ncbi:MAG TPA: thiamine pyrophosphate-dependent dehydrogenase E1 component subunit alpha [Nitrososphaerales archaeon]|nr:thiamine pyrophosphate-dependent dehydrogenase E1 component subunit alpha [Nitrososphaerales archaeon]
MAWKHSPVVPKTPLSAAQRAHQRSILRQVHTTVPSPAQMLKMYRNMVRIRAFETAVLENARKGDSLAIHPYTGEEAVSTGVCSVLRTKDKVVTNHRPFGHFISKGGSMKGLMAEVYGKSNGICKGLGGEMNLSEPKIGFLLSDMIVGACITIATGAALKEKMDKTRNAVVCFFGEAATANGAFHEGLMMASLWGLPILYVCENNGYSTNTPIVEFLSNETVAPRVAGYGMRTTVVDGTDVIGVRQRTEEALWRIRHGGGPCFIEAIVKRIGPHKQELVDSRPDGERRLARMRDPIKMFGAQLSEEGILTDTLEAKMRAEVKEEVEESMRFAERGLRLTLDQAQRFVYAD